MSESSKQSVICRAPQTSLFAALLSHYSAGSLSKADSTLALCTRFPLLSLNFLCCQRGRSERTSNSSWPFSSPPYEPYQLRPDFNLRAAALKRCSRLFIYCPEQIETFSSINNLACQEDGWFIPQPQWSPVGRLLRRRDLLDRKSEAIRGYQQKKCSCSTLQHI